MQVFKAFFRILYKNKASLLMYIVIYLALAVTVGNVLEENSKTEFSGVSLDIGLENKDKGSLGDGLEEYLGSQNQILGVPEKKEDLQDAMYYEELDYVLVIPEDFTEKFLAGEQEGLLEGTVVPGSSSAYLVEQEMVSFLRTLAMYLKAGYGEREAVARTLKDVERKAEVQFLEAGDSQGKPTGFYYFQYIPYVFLIMMILGVGGCMKAFQNKDLAARNKCSSMSFLSQNLQIFLGCAVYMVIVYAAFLGMACLNVGDYMLSLRGALNAANAFVFGICSLSVAWFAVQFAQSSAMLTILSNVFGLGFSFLGGVFVSVDMMGESARNMAKFVPSYWYVVANEEIQKVGAFAEGEKVYQAFGMVLMFSLAFFSAGLLVNRMKVKSK
ncbi:ABC transporter permease [Lachnospiraceae bacterium JLR.KK009]|jgi:hypothetical protein|nr:hypothetical protein C810_02022 [Lachnospiraceae bacterium A2]MCI8706754.1 ABC transporter permease [Lachnospiraceae bacterium]